MSERLFIAIGFDSELSKRLERDVKKVKINLDRSEVGYKWSPPSNYHVTLAFLGETDEIRKAQIISQLQQLAIEPFDLLISGVDAFDSVESARVIYCGVQNKKSLRALVDQIRENLGLAPDESYSPHLTIARLRNPSHVADEISPVRRKDFFKIRVQEIRLYRSRMAGNYPLYEVLETFPFLEKTADKAD